MKFRLMTALAAMLLLAAAGAQDAGQQQLPSAPSSTKQPETAPKPAPVPVAAPAPQQPAKPVQSDPAAKSQPAKTAADPVTSSPDKGGSGSADENAVTTIKKSVDEVNVIFTVTDKRGRFIKNLKKEDFRVLDDNKPPQALKDFHSQTDLPLRVGLLVDASNSVRTRFLFEQESAIEFLNQTVRSKADRAFVIGFDTTAEITQDFTDSTEKLARGIRSLRPGGGTALYDAVYFACRDKLRKLDETVAVRRAIILLSDGDDNQSRVTREEAIEMAQRAEVIVYTISTNDSGIKQRGDKTLERFAEATGGRAFFPFKVQDVANAFTEIQDELRSQYQLAYKPANFVADGSYRTIDIAPVNGKNLRVRARKGYYAPKQ